MFNAVRNQRGQGVLEYIILTSLIGIFCLVSVKQFGKVIENRIDGMREQIVEHIPTK
ncbi:MAG: hypothetical protein ACN6I6_00235 [bacterium]